jgi:hypothetical protein
MLATINSYHPRNKAFGKADLIPLSEPTGMLNWKISEKVLGIDVLGKAVSMYFKMLKSFVLFFIWVTILCIPLFILYSSGEMQQSSNATMLSTFSLGNLGQS